MDLGNLRIPTWDEIVRNAAHQVGDLALLIVIAVVAWILSDRLVRGMVRALFDRETTEGTSQELSAVEIAKRKATLQGLGVTVLHVLILIVTVPMALGLLGFDIGPVIAGLGVVGIAVGFGAQSLVRDYLAGAFIIVENHFAKGDVVRIADVTGTVEDFSLRRTTLRDVDGTVHIVPNGLIGVASNLTRVWNRILLDITVPYGTDIDRVTELVDELGRQMAAQEVWHRRILEAPRVDRVDALGESGVTLKVTALVRAGDRVTVSGELRKEILASFTANGIEIARPQRVVVSSRTTGPADAGSTEAGLTDAGPTDEELAAGAD
jgi:small-conductance mechanosensitive channel